MHITIQVFTAQTSNSANNVKLKQTRNQFMFTSVEQKNPLGLELKRVVTYLFVASLCSWRHHCKTNLTGWQGLFPVALSMLATGPVLG